MTGREVPADVVERLRAICLALPEAYQEQAWTGTRWCVRKKTFAHAVVIDAGWPPAYARAAGTDGPACVITFRSEPPELDVLGSSGHPFFRPPWAPDIVGMQLDEGTDWTEVRELLTDSYCTLAPQKLVALVPRPT
ncbi:MmcQ/YjbR family DNA-binding protein [Pseudonocardia sp. TRM90224]|uniref:MmcQ/YjbR family DNA-binding protein n=1 Tax=Pseudonocardia sp. TRM90224 TaxID=2812678 RepID=UPI001E64CB35|nr:MmcQ/YjbR family DNA-binding protein [Pseudonocardia sp. TRM90224]